MSGYGHTHKALTLALEPKANVERYDGLRLQILGAVMRHDPASAALSSCCAT